jgi:hypothetical protein
VGAKRRCGGAYAYGRRGRGGAFSQPKQRGLVYPYARAESGISFHPEDAKGLMIAAINDPNPVMYFEHKALYRSIAGKVPVGYYEVPIGKARTVQQGDDVTIITYGAGALGA